MKKITLLFLFTTSCTAIVIAQLKFVSVKVKDIVGTNGKPFIMKGTPPSLVAAP